MGAKANLRILIIIHSYWPKNTPRAYRWTTLAEHLVSCGHTVDVVASAAAGVPSEESVSGVSIFRTCDLLEALTTGASAVRVDRTGPQMRAQGRNWPARRRPWLKKLYRNSVAKAYWPDSVFLWIIPAFLKARKLLGRNHYDGIITVAHPFSSHVVGLLLGRWRRGTPWICDYGDPFSVLEATPPNNFKLYGRLNRYVEQKVMSASRKLAVTTDETAAEYGRRLGIPNSWFVTIPPLYKRSGNPLNHEERPGCAGQEIVRLLFLGTLYKDIRNPRFLLNLIDKLNALSAPPKVMIDFVGDTEDCRDEFMDYSHANGRWLFIRGMCTRDAVAQFLMDADVLVNIGNSTTFQLPSKIVEYVATGKPILNIASIPEDATAKYLRDYPAALTVFEAEDPDETVIKRCAAFLRGPARVDGETVDRIIARHSTEVIAGQYVRLLSNEVTAK